MTHSVDRFYIFLWIWLFSISLWVHLYSIDGCAYSKLWLTLAIKFYLVQSCSFHWAFRFWPHSFAFMSRYNVINHQYTRDVKMKHLAFNNCDEEVYLCRLKNSYLQQLAKAIRLMAPSHSKNLPKILLFLYFCLAKTKYYFLLLLLLVSSPVLVVLRVFIFTFFN